MFDLEIAHNTLNLYLPLAILTLGWVFPWELFLILTGGRALMLSRTFLFWRMLIYVFLVYLACEALSIRYNQYIVDLSATASELSIQARYFQIWLLFGLCFFFSFGFSLYPLRVAINQPTPPLEYIRKAVVRHFIICWCLTGIIVYCVFMEQWKIAALPISIIEKFVKQLNTIEILAIILVTIWFTYRLLHIAFTISPNQIRGFMRTERQFTAR